MTDNHEFDKEQPVVEKREITLDQARREVEIEDLFVAGCALNQPANS